MPWYGFIHPILAIITFVYGTTIAQLTISKLEEWDFPLHRLQKRSMIYFLLTLANLILGFLFNTILANQGRRIVLLAHSPMAVTATILALLATLVTRVKSRRPGELPPVIRWHPLLAIASLALIMTMGFLALLKLLKI